MRNFTSFVVLAFLGFFTGGAIAEPASIVADGICTGIVLTLNEGTGAFVVVEYKTGLSISFLPAVPMDIIAPDKKSNATLEKGMLVTVVSTLKEGTYTAQKVTIHKVVYTVPPENRGERGGEANNTRPSGFIATTWGIPANGTNGGVLISTSTPNTFTVRARNVADPSYAADFQYDFSPATAYVDATGASLESVNFTEGQPVAVLFKKEAGRSVASKIVILKAPGFETAGRDNPGLKPKPATPTPVAPPPRSAVTAAGSSRKDRPVPTQVEKGKAGGGGRETSSAGRPAPPR